MPVYLYCFVPDDCGAPPAGLAGVDGLPVRAAALGRLRAWVSDVPGPAPEATAERARAHDAVVRAAMAVETPLPARFGQVAADDAALAAAVEGRAASFAEALAHVRGAVEMTVRLLPGGAEASRPPGAAPRAVEGSAAVRSGRAYLERVRERTAAEEEWRRRAGFLQDEVSHAVAAIVRDETRPALLSPVATLAMAHLVPRERVGAYRAAIGGLRERDPALPMMLSGPWAPYSFAPHA
ncbi:MAG TPA: GvpL/GvpF family gas vesicle protein [Gemmatimonadaceae bacterium]|nr:GvpL/GvpF family gas vesicle protein [Gemmatimonadaceae bacterium]